MISSSFTIPAFAAGEPWYTAITTFPFILNPSNRSNALPVGFTLSEMPASDKVSNWVSGQFDSIAVRVTDHPLVQKMCNAFGKPLTSTSANLSGLPPCMTTEEVEEQLGDKLVVILRGETSGRDKPSEIRDAKTSQILRQG